VLTPNGAVVEYQLEVDTWTLVFEDLPAVLSREDMDRLSRSGEFYAAFTRSYAPILAGNLVARLDGKALAFTCRQRKHEELDHVRCTFLFEAPWQLQPGARHDLTFREGNYELESGLIRLSLAHESPLTVWSKTEPEEALLARAAIDLRPGDSARLRTVAARFSVPAPRAVELGEPTDRPAAQGQNLGAASALPASLAVVVLAVLWVLRRRLRDVARGQS
jgi:hypothetical protein